MAARLHGIDRTVRAEIAIAEEIDVSRAAERRQPEADVADGQPCRPERTVGRRLDGRSWSARVPAPDSPAPWRHQSDHAVRKVRVSRGGK